MRRLLSVAAIVASAVVALAAPGGSGAYPGQNGLVAFAREDTSGAGFAEHIWTVDPLTGAEVQLTDDPDVLDQQPEYSPDGSKIAFSRDTGNQGLIAVMNADGTGITPLTDDDGNTCPTWSPDGTRIAYSDGPGDIVIIAAADGTVLVTLPIGTCELSWSPLGDLIAFSRGNGIEVVAPVDGAVPSPVTTNVLDGFPGWSPDGRRIVFERDGSIVTVRPDGTDEVVVLSGDDYLMPAWSPDGTRIVVTFSANGSFAGSIVTVAADGGPTTTLTEESETTADLQPDWQPLPVVPPPPPPVPVEPTFTG
jgi:Tol biopolymer transport system component